MIRAPGPTLLNTIVAEDVTQTVDFGGNNELGRRHFTSPRTSGPGFAGMTAWG